MRFEMRSTPSLRVKAPSAVNERLPLSGIRDGSMRFTPVLLGCAKIAIKAREKANLAPLNSFPDCERLRAESE